MAKLVFNKNNTVDDVKVRKKNIKLNDGLDDMSDAAVSATQ